MTWGDALAIGSASGSNTTVIAFDLGQCDGKLMYRAVEWYENGQTNFDTHNYLDVCRGTYIVNGVPQQTP